MEVEPRALATDFNLNFNLPISIMAQNFKDVKIRLPEIIIKTLKQSKK